MDWRRVTGIVLLVAALLFGLRQILPSDGPPGLVGLGEPHFVVYFSSETDGRLMPEHRSGFGTVEERLAVLQHGPKTKGLVNMLPRGTEVIGYELERGILTVNFNERLRSGHSGGSYGELLTVYGVVNSLVEAPTVERVRIVIEGQVQDTLVGHLNLREPLAGDRSLLGQIP